MSTKAEQDDGYYYKYVTADTAISILKNETVRFSDPRKFNDPFDTQIELRINFDFKKFNKAMFSKLNKIKAPPAFNVNVHLKVSHLLGAKPTRLAA